ncbi:MAG: hypothetical protein CR982_03400 [Candidatus Cloacimonadota bacterium]|nr:MAG: hypothetical protein CR982_03400 [Candidatus Cloacimonadota bacterium]PIE78829.1 MAG: hypothetical protein CSA15_05855 [Candidatus Delongbacteria bacterium]
MKIAVDLMGGDKAPEVIIEGCSIFLNGGTDSNLHLVGSKIAVEKAKSLSVLKDCSFDICEDFISMKESMHSFSKNRDETSINRAMKLHKSGVVDAVFSAGNSGAIIYTAMDILGKLDSSLSPALLTLVPKTDLKYLVLLDIGGSGNRLVEKDYLLYLAKSGSDFYKYFFDSDSPKVGLLNIGEERYKGTHEHTLAFNELESSSLNFSGNIEGDKIFDTDIDVLVTDGFTGNIILKLMESFYDIMTKKFDDIGVSKLIRNSNYYPKDLKYENIGGALLLGVDGNVTIGHGKSTPRAIASGLGFAERYYKKTSVEKN